MKKISFILCLIFLSNFIIANGNIGLKNLPLDVLNLIAGYLGYKDVSKLKLIEKEFEQLAEAILINKLQQPQNILEINLTRKKGSESLLLLKYINAISKNKGITKPYLNINVSGVNKETIKDLLPLCVYVKSLKIKLINEKFSKDRELVVKDISESPYLENLEILDFRFLNIDDSHANYIFSSPYLINLETLILGGIGPLGRHSGEWAKNIARFNKLKKLDLADTLVNCEVVNNISSLSLLEELNLGGTQIDDTCMEAIAQLSNLKKLSLGGLDNFFHPAFALKTIIDNVKNLTVLNFGVNSEINEIAHYIANSDNLRHLTTLNLWNFASRINDDAIMAIINSKKLPNLKVFSINKEGLKEETLEALKSRF